jgi:hypothetical protein
MREGFYKLEYTTDTLSNAGIITLFHGRVAGCDKNYFMRGSYKNCNHNIIGVITFERHTPIHGRIFYVPETFSVQLSGVNAKICGYFNFVCNETGIKGFASFRWLGKYHG